MTVFDPYATCLTGMSSINMRDVLRRLCIWMECDRTECVLRQKSRWMPGSARTASQVTGQSLQVMYAALMHEHCTQREVLVTGVVTRRETHHVHLAAAGSQTGAVALSLHR